MEHENKDVEPLSAEEEREAKLLGLSREPLFPILIFLVAVFKDFFDIATGGFLALLASFMAGIIIWFWMFGKIGMIKKRLLRWFLKRFVIGLLVDSIPIISMLPITTILVLMAHNKETKIVRVLFAGLEKLSPLVGKV